MKFDEAINYIAETTLDVEMAKPKNPEIDRLVASGMPYWKARQIVRRGAPASAATPTNVPAAASSFRELPDTLRTKDAVAVYLQHRPEASEAEITNALATQNSDDAPLNLDPVVIQTAIDDVRGAESELEQEPDPNALRKSELLAKYDRVRQALYRLHGFTKARGSSGRKEIPSEPEEEPTDTELVEPKIDMRDEPVDPTEL